MKKKIFGSIAVLAFAAIVAFNVGLTKSSDNLLSDINLANIEALAQYEGSVSNCPGGSCTFSDNFGNKCSACCPEWKNTRCKCIWL